MGMLRSEYIQAVVQPAIHVLGAVAGLKCEVDHVQMASTIPTLRSICVGVSFEGVAEGGAYLAVDPLVGVVIAKKMNGSTSDRLSEAEVVEALMELVNMFAGHAIGAFMKNGLKVEITPPERHLDPPPVPYGADCALIFLKSEVGPIKVGVILAKSSK